MKKLRDKLGKLAQRIIDKAMGNDLMQEETLAKPTASPALSSSARPKTC